MEEARVKMREIGPDEFQTSLFESNADVFCPVIFKPEHYGLNNTLPEAIEFQNSITKNWWSLVGPAGIGQFTAKNDCSAFIIALHSALLREATLEEAMVDFSEFGEQVMGDEVNENDPSFNDGRTSFPFLDKQFYYNGPSRIVRSEFYARTGQGNMPTLDEIKELMVEVNAPLKNQNDYGYRREPGIYYFIFADRGEMHIYGFEKAEKFDFSEAQYLGNMELTNNKLLFFPAGDREEAIDFSINLYRGN